MPPSTFDEVLDAIDHFPLDIQAELLEVARRRLADQGRRRLLLEVREAEAAFENGHDRPSTVDEIIREIES